jgi:hypothetical protein
MVIFESALIVGLILGLILELVLHAKFFGAGPSPTEEIITAAIVAVIVIALLVIFGVTFISNIVLPIIGILFAVYLVYEYGGNLFRGAITGIIGLAAFTAIIYFALKIIGII